MEVVPKICRDGYLLSMLICFLDFPKMYSYRTVLAGEAQLYKSYGMSGGYMSLDIDVGKPGSHIGRSCQERLHRGCIREDNGLCDTCNKQT